MKIVTIQDSFEEVLEDIRDARLEEDKFWVAQRDSDPNATQDLWYFTVNKEGINASDKNLTFEVKNTKKYEVKINNEVYRLQAPIRTKSFTSDPISCADMANDDSIAVLGTKYGDVLIIDVADFSIKKRIQNAHFSDVTSVRVFPSNKVIISTGTDLRLKIWDLEGNLAREMSHHKSEITSINLLGKTGRNFLSGSKDGTVNLWECGSGQVLYTFKRISDERDPVNCVATDTDPSAGHKLSDLEIETDHTCMYVGHESGVIQKFDVGNHCLTGVKLILSDKAAVTSLISSRGIVIAGYNNGRIVFWNPIDQKPIFETRLNDSYAIDHMNVLHHDENDATLLVANGPETLLRLTVKGSQLERVTYLVGLEEAFAVTDIAYMQRVLITTQYQIALYSST
ncbi:Piso0_001439 [Millerozyma farinosa CBS 7064]|uniref:Piso0_001439 protein n=1 Tax=Pichia sorbitophila (strain ATCC MYA-4447 / BCRC 22081 / CBS 7064 / NBRC 10061 / NRRL Y-12695) TaxID=559304 RepID=G8YKS9_PICSO|nr:Piso0_001439 [Millerozyma farinosa CBS 7064]